MEFEETILFQLRIISLFNLFPKKKSINDVKKNRNGKAIEWQ